MSWLRDKNQEDFGRSFDMGPITPDNLKRRQNDLRSLRPIWQAGRPTGLYEDTRTPAERYRDREAEALSRCNK